MDVGRHQSIHLRHRKPELQVSFDQNSNCGIKLIFHIIIQARVYETPFGTVLLEDERRTAIIRRSEQISDGRSFIAHLGDNLCSDKKT